MKTAENNRSEDIAYIDSVNDTIWKLRTTNVNGENPMMKAQEVMEKALALNYGPGIARGKLNYGMGVFILNHNSEEALRLLNESLEMFKEMSDERWIANVYLTIAIISSSAGKPDIAYYHSLRGIPYYENKNNDNDGDAIMAYYVAGTILKDLKKYSEAESYYKKGLAASAVENSWTGRIYTSLANICNNRGDFRQALDLSFKSLNILEQEKNIIGISRALTDIGVIERNLKNFDKALEHFFKALEIREQTGIKHFILGSLIDIAVTYCELENAAKAISYFHRAEQIAFETNHEARLNSIFTNLAKQYKEAGESEMAIRYYEKLIDLNEKIHRREREAKLEGFQDSLLKEKEQEIERLKNVELKNAYDLISEKNKEITDSIHYAQRIQKTLLASEELLKSNLKDHFIFFQPKDIVSGDFYWARNVSWEFRVGSSQPGAVESEDRAPYRNSQSAQLLTQNCFYLAVCDSTGHGVPGAFMSLLNSTFLNEAVNQKQIFEPGKILDYVRERLISSLSQDGAQDGMDGTLLCITYENGRPLVRYASANKQAILCSKGKLTTLNADKMPVGKGEKTNPFNTFEVQPEPGDMLYIFTDGYADQFGGPKGKKFMNRQLEALLQKICLLNPADQYKALDGQFSEWKGTHQQIDDVLVVGLRF